jgi:phosphatidate cytidylyltransferase
MYWGGEWAYWAMILVPGIAALNEFFAILDRGGVSHHGRIGLWWGALSMIGALWAGRAWGADAAVAFASLALAGGCFAVFSAEIFKMEASPGATPIEIVPVAMTTLALLYIPFLSSFFSHILYLTPRQSDGGLTGQWYILYLVSVTKFSDCGAYVFGSVFGRHPMIPRVSPKKTWEGFLGAVLVPVLLSVLLYFWMPTRLSLLHSAGHAVVLGLCLALGAVVGDLAESVFKRATGAKDSGHFLPGIGGALDLVDSLLFTAAPFYLYLRHYAL